MIIRQNSLIHTKEFFLYSKDSELLKGFKAGRKMMTYAGLKLANWIMVLMGT